MAAERLAELVLSRRHDRLMRAKGGVEVGAAHYPAMVAMHAGFLLSCAVESLLRRGPTLRWLSYGALGFLLVAQLLRWSALISLGERWTTRIIVIPGAPLISSGLYQYLRHPNYLAVVIEIAALPLIRGGWLTAIIFSLLNAAILRIRIDAEEQALGLNFAPPLDNW
jgi:methyltransferase